ncbi:MAG TPA: MMPL family transporter [Acidimicrobiales bacterium]|nr:MMPL family transporter [Acidimicrobiales bacterium]
MRPLAQWCVRHRRVVVLCWLAILVVVSGISHAAGTRYSNNFDLPKTQSTEAIRLLQSILPRASGDVERIVIATTPPAKVTDAPVEARVDAMLAAIRKFPHVTNVLSPYEAAGADQVSKDGIIAFATVTFDEQPQSLSSIAKDFVHTARSADAPGVHVAVSGQLGEQSNRPALSGTGLGILLAGVVLLLVFGSVFAMALPLLSALVSLGTAIGLIGLLSHVMKMPQFADQLVLLIGLGVGVDYALFIVTRHRQGLMAGRDVETSIVEAVNTSGRAVMFAGIIVCIALLGMFALGVSFLYGMAVSAAIGVALTMIAALTLLPALLGFIGPRVMSRRQKRGLALNGPRIVGTGSRGFWVRWAGFVRGHPILPALIALGLVVLVALPFFSMRLGSSDQGNDPRGTTTRDAYDLLARGFGPGFNGPLQVVSVLHAPGDRAAFDRAVADIKDQRDVAGTSTPLVVPGRGGSQVALLQVYPSSAPQDAATTRLISQLRTQTLPRALAGSHVTAYVGGTTAIFVDFAHVLSNKLPVFIAAVVLLSFLLLALVFRSLVVPLISAAMNMLSIGAAFGVVVAVFGWDWAGSIIGVNRPGPVEAFLPVMLFAILFGLSMDYQVFLVTRIHEERLRTGNNGDAVQRGLAATGKTITAAALIMILVFGSFVLGGQVVIKEFGLGLAAGILIDAVMIRMAIVPAVMLLTREANWWFPRFLDRLFPHIGLEVPHVEAVAAPTDAGTQGPGKLISR